MVKPDLLRIQLLKVTLQIGQLGLQLRLPEGDVSNSLFEPCTNLMLILINGINIEFMKAEKWSLSHMFCPEFSLVQEVLGLL